MTVASFNNTHTTTIFNALATKGVLSAVLHQWIKTSLEERIIWSLDEATLGSINEKSTL